MDRAVYLGARVRPLSERDISLRSKSVVLVQGDCTTVVNPSTGDAKAFVLDFSYNSFDPLSSSYASNRTIFNDVGPMLLQDVWDGYNCSLFVIGAPQSGKTHTLVGEESEPGMIPQFLELLFQTIAKYEEQPNATERIIVDSSFCEIYAEHVRDMLTKDYQPGGLKIRQKEDIVFVDGLTRMRLNTMSDCEELLALLLSSMSSITPNAHTIFTISITKIPKNGKPTAENPAIRSKLHFVELSSGASENKNQPMSLLPKPTTSSAQDRSLLAWTNVMGALARQQTTLEAMAAVNGGKVPTRAMQQVRGKTPRATTASSAAAASKQPNPAAMAYSLDHVPFRSSVLTRLLQDSMGDRSRSFVLATLSAAHTRFRETLNTFRCVVRCKEASRPRKTAANTAAAAAASSSSQLPAIIGPEGDADWRFIPAAGGGWRWSYATRVDEFSQR